MAEPRIFISSTFFDLRQVRTDIDSFIRDIGYSAIRHELGDIPYGKEEALEEYCYKEIGKCDILVSIIGGRIGHSSTTDEEFSISQMELKVAKSLEKQLYIFVEKNVYHEFETFRSWPIAERESFRPFHADSNKVHSFIAEVTSQSRNNAVFTFEAASEIISICKRQWAGLFQGLLLQQERKPEIDLVSKLNESIQVMDRLVKYFESKEGETTQALLLSNHPFFEDLKKNLDVPFNVQCYSLNELSSLLEYLRWTRVPEIEWKSSKKMEWVKSEKGVRVLMRISGSLFDSEHKLIPFTPQEWKDEVIEKEVYE